ncbi:NAD-dependent epimerase/dehydratase family protein, partial [Myxococcota bacterium]|nr:NAD-dependent epimerase/dehydratase family protein [Myxococcota bacterium]MBU1537720.1 NAD-dependent epimerase/dehydratase family protein [Myxococcota bacterium]
YGIDVSIVRYFTVFGPAGRPDMSIFRFARGIIEETPITVTGDGTQSRDFTYVDDIARGTVLALKPLGFKVINLGGGRTPSSINDLVAFIEARTGKKAILLHAPMAREDMVSTWAEIGRAADLLGWSPQVTLEEGLDLTMDWHLANRDFVASCRP